MNNHKQGLHVTCSEKFRKLCYLQSQRVYPVVDGHQGSKHSAGRFLLIAGIEKLKTLKDKNGKRIFDDKYLDQFTPKYIKNRDVYFT